MDHSSATRDEPDTAASEITSSTPGETQRQVHNRRYQLVLLAVAVSAGRWLFAADRRVFYLVPDELAVAGMARWLSGTNDWNMLISNTWQPGYSLLLAPWFWLFDDPASLYRAMIAANAALGGVAAVQLALLLRKMVRIDTRWCILVAGTISLLPPGLSASAQVWAEPAVAILVLATLSGAIGASASEMLRLWCIPIITAACGYLVHGRLLPLVPVVVMLALAAAVRRRAWMRAGALGVFGVGCYTAVSQFSRWVFSEVWLVQLNENSVETVADRLLRPGQVLDALAGQVWYQLVSTAGVVVLGSIAIVRAAVGRWQETGPSPIAARVVLALVVPLVLTSVVFMADRPRPDMLVYGRYNDSVLQIVLAVGAVHLVRSLRAGAFRAIVVPLGASALVAVELAFFLSQYHRKQLRGTEAIKPMIAGVAPMMGTDPSLSLLRVTWVGLLASVAVLVAVWLARRSVLMLALAAGLTAIAAGLATHHSLDFHRNDLLPASDVSRWRRQLTSETVGVAFVPDFAAPSIEPTRQLGRALAYQWFVPEMRVRAYFGPSPKLGPYVFAPDNTEYLLSTEARIVWEDGSGMALWIDDSPATPRRHGTESG